MMFDQTWSFLKLRIFPEKILIGAFVFISLYAGALYAFAVTYVNPGDVLDPSGLPGDYTVRIFPNQTGHAGEYLTTDGSGNLSWDSVSGSGSPAGSDGEVQFNDGGSFGASSHFFWDNSTNRLGIKTNTPEASLHLLASQNIIPGTPGTIGSTSYTPTGPGELDDATFGGDYSGDSDCTIAAGIATTAPGNGHTNDEFIWGYVSGSCSGGSGTPTEITPGAPQALENGITITFASGTGHTPLGEDFSSIWTAAVTAGTPDTTSPGDDPFLITNGDDATVFKVANDGRISVGGSIGSSTVLIHALEGYRALTIRNFDDSSLLFSIDGLGDADLFGDLSVGGNSLAVNGVDYTWPSSQAGGSGYVLTNDGSGGLSWTVPDGGGITVDATSYNIFSDNINAGTSLTSGTTNTFFGRHAGSVNTEGSSNIFIGPYSGSSNTTGNNNVFLGSNAGFTSMMGDDNIFIGTNAGYQANGAHYNVFLGAGAGYSNLSGNLNVAIGYNAGSVASNYHNTFIGAYADATINTVTESIALGSYSKVSNSNTFVAGSQDAPITDVYFGGGEHLGWMYAPFGYTIHGTDANGNNLKGGDITLMSGAGSGNADGGDIRIGVAPGGSCGTPSSGSTNGTLCRGIFVSGNYGEVSFGSYTQSPGTFYTFPYNDGSSGDVLVTDGAGVITWEDPSLLPSDISLKTNINPISYGLETLENLRPVSYTLIASGRPQVGFIAQEVETVVPELVGVISGDKKGIQYGQLSAVIVKAIQELDLKVQNLELLTGEATSIAGQFTETILRVKSIVFGSSEDPTGFTMYDTVTKEPYCVTLTSGDFVKTPGVCGEDSNLGSSGSGDGDDIQTEETVTPDEQEEGGSGEEITTENPSPQAEPAPIE